MVVPILPPRLLPLALPRLRASKSGSVLPEGYNGEEFVQGEAKKKEATRVRIMRWSPLFLQKSKYDTSN